MTSPEREGAGAPEGLNLWIAGARPRTLPAAAVPVLVGTAIAVPTDMGVTPWRFLAALVVALALQVGTNYANDYSDGVRGTDGEDRVGPLRLVGSGLVPARSVKMAAVASFAVAGVAGFALAAAVSWWLLAVGAVSFAAGWLYTGGPRPYGYAGLGEVFVFVFFGLVATVGANYVQEEAIRTLALLAAVPVGLLATALLVINNLRDIDSDVVAGKRTLAVRLGDQRTRLLYAALMVTPYVVVPVVAGGSGRIYAAAALLSVLLARVPVMRVLQGATGADLIPVLASTARVQAVFGLIFAAGLAYGPV